MLTYALTKTGGVSLYEQLYRRVKDDILTGRLATGEKLPSKRALAAHLEASVITVKNAYEQLMAEGYIYGMEKKGYYVSPVQRPLTAPAHRQEAAPPAEHVWEMDLVTNSIAAEDFPFTVWARLMRQTILEQGTGLLRPMPPQGAPELRRAIAAYLRQFRGMTVDEEQIIIGAGTEQLYNMLVQLLGQDKRYAVEDPGYGKIARIYRSNQAEVVSVPLDGAGLSVSALGEAGADVVHISPSHHYPTGIVMPIARRQELLHWAAQGNDRFILEDDYDSEFRFVGRPIPTLFSVDEAGRVIYLNTFSKTIAPSIRISYMVLPEEIAKAYREKLGFFSCPVPSIEQYTLASFIAEGYFDRHISRMRKYYREVRRLLTDGLGGAVSSGKLQIRGQDSGLHFLMTVDTTRSDAELCRLFRGHGVKIRALSEFMFEKKSDTHTLLVNDSSLSPESAAGAAKKILECLSDC